MRLSEHSVALRPDHKEEDSCPGVGDAGPDIDGSAATCVLDDVDVPTSTG